MISLVKTSNKYYKLRLRVYYKLVPYFKRNEINKSLKTKKLTEARMKASEILNEYFTIKLYSDLKKTTEEQLKKLSNDFILNTLELHQRESKRVKPHLNTNKNTYKRVIDDFCIYYNSKEISKETQQAVTSFLQTVLIELVDPKQDIKDTTLNDLIEIKKLISNLPSRNLKEYKDKSIKQLIKMNIPNEHKLSFGRVQTYINYIKKFFKYCQAHQIITYNPAEFITITSSLSPLEEREAYTKEEIKSLFSLLDNLEDKNKSVIYYTLAYTGMRLSELWKSSIKCSNGIYYFDLTNKSIQLKTKGSYRLIPFHKVLTQKNIHTKLPIALSTFKRSYITHYFTDSIKSKISSNSKKVLYSLRHTFATELKYAKVDPIVISELMGHSHEGMTMGRYASRYPIEVLKEAIDKLEF